MQVTTERQDACNVELKIEIPAARVAEAVGKVYKEYAKEAEVPGFRRGKAPVDLVKRYVTEDSVRRRTIEMLAPEAYNKAIEDEKLEPYTDPEMEIVEFEQTGPFIFKAKVPLPPKIELGEYKGIEVERPEVKITDEDVESQLESLRNSRATTEKITDRGLQTSDIAVAEIASAIEGEEMSEARRSLIEVGTNIPGFDEQIAGMSPGDRRNFTVDYTPEEGEEDQTPKKMTFDVAVESIRERKVPELNDEFAQAMGLESLDQLREDIKIRLTASAEENADREVEVKIIDEIVSRSNICFPDILVEHEMEHDFHDLQHRLEQQGLTIEDFLRQTEKSEEDLIEEMKKTARRRVMIGLALAEIAEAEGIKVTEDDVEAEIQRTAEQANVPRESVETYLETRGGREAIHNGLMNKRLMDMLRSSAKIKSSGEVGAEST